MKADFSGQLFFNVLLVKWQFLYDYNNVMYKKNTEQKCNSAIN